MPIIGVVYLREGVMGNEEMVYLRTTSDFTPQEAFATLKQALDAGLAAMQ